MKQKRLDKDKDFSLEVNVMMTNHSKLAHLCQLIHSAFVWGSLVESLQGTKIRQHLQCVKIRYQSFLGNLTKDNSKGLSWISRVTIE